jgi:hypothetical protein
LPSQAKTIDAKIATVADIVQGRRIASETVEISIKGVVLGFPATLEAFRPGFPFGVNYVVETKVVDDPLSADNQALKLVFAPRYAHGLLASLARLVLFEPRGTALGEGRIDERFICRFNQLDEAKRFARYPGVADKLLSLNRTSHFSELVIKADAGLYLSQPVSFNQLDLDVCRETFRILGELGQVVFDAFS